MKQEAPLSVTSRDVREAAERIGPYVRVTPVFTTEIGGRPVTFKLENLQVTGSFKFRGALNGIIAHNTGGHVVAASSGNHGLGVATAAKITGLSATVYVPNTTPEAKARRIAAQGARVVRHGARYADAEAAARAWAEQSGGSYVHAYDNPAVIAGQGTVGLEITRDAPWCEFVARRRWRWWPGGGPERQPGTGSHGGGGGSGALQQPARGICSGPAGRRSSAGLGGGVSAWHDTGRRE